MSLAAALRTAQSSLMAKASQTAVASRNIAGASDPAYSRKLAITTTDAATGAQIVTIRRATDQALFAKLLSSTSSSAAQQAIVASLEMLEQTVGDPEAEHSPAARITALSNAIQQFAVAPSDTVLAQAVVTEASSLADALNAATATVQQVRADADAAIAGSVAAINDLLAQFEALNAAVVNGSRSGADVTDALDARDALLARLSEEIGITTVSRSDNDIAIYTDSGISLFDIVARTVTFEPTRAYAAGTSGNAVVVDGVPLFGNGATMPIGSGRLEGLALIRDEIAVAFQTQLDEIARGLIEAFAESDQSVPATLPDVPGLFTYSGAPAIPIPGIASAGLAGEISVNANVDPGRGGSLTLLRDGGISDPGNPAYIHNASGAASYSGLLQDYLDQLGAARAFDSGAGLGPSATLVGFAGSSVSWLEAARAEAAQKGDYHNSLLARTSEALSNATGVNLDNEMSILLELERSYQASSKLISAVDMMFASLLEAVG
ncbi:MAG TPA: flagellar hook-associated protein FlgK [Propylenella sp.]|nr:flagellar hook-associated protein FlgK [Propylenella sp.]